MIKLQHITILRMESMMQDYPDDFFIAVNTDIKPLRKDGHIELYGQFLNGADPHYDEIGPIWVSKDWKTRVA